MELPVGLSVDPGAAEEGVGLCVALGLCVVPAAEGVEVVFSAAEDVAEGGAAGMEGLTPMVDVDVALLAPGDGDAVREAVGVDMAEVEAVPVVFVPPALCAAASAHKHSTSQARMPAQARK